jgi:chitin disaccharide deacetylase
VAKPSAITVLIVNADDFASGATATDAICEAFDARAITSASGMVWMRDSVRAATIAAERALPLGLHLNLTLPFSGADVPRAAQERQRRLTELFTRDGWWREADRRFERGLLRDAIEDQVERFCEQFGQPTHIDGHHHVHVYDEVLAVLPRTWPVRRILRTPGQADAGLDSRERRLHQSFRGPDLSLAFERIHPALGGSGVQVLERARERCVEVMTHPLQAAEQEALKGSLWRATLDSLPLGSYVDLRAD